MIELKEEQRILLSNIRKVVREKVEPAAAETDRTAEFNREIANLFWDLGLLQIMLPEEYGGWPQSPCHTLCLSIEEIAKACASSALILVIQAVGTYPLLSAGNERQKQRYLPWVSEKRHLMGYLVTEPGAGSDVAS
jgi:cyclohexane-1-carbonyl-CoA dehydrogenase